MTFFEEFKAKHYETLVEALLNTSKFMDAKCL
jgi:hypothetical protein